MAIRLPSQVELKPGPMRDLVASVHGLYRAAGFPGTPRIARRTRERIEDLPSPVSHDTVNALLKGRRLPGWLIVHSIVAVLAEFASHGPHEQDEITKHHQLWMAANDSLNLSIGSRQEDAKVLQPTSVLVLDFVGSGDLTDLERRNLHERFNSAWLAALREADWTGDVAVHSMGDGVLLREHGEELVSASLRELFPLMSGALERDNAQANSGPPLRIRGSVHVAEGLRADRDGLWGPDLTDAIRLGEAMVLREAMAAKSCPNVGLLVSERARRCAEPFPHSQGMRRIGTMEQPGKRGLLPDAWLFLP